MEIAGGVVNSLTHLAQLRRHFGEDDLDKHHFDIFDRHVLSKLKYLSQISSDIINIISAYNRSKKENKKKKLAYDFLIGAIIMQHVMRIGVTTASQFLDDTEYFRKLAYASQIMNFLNIFTQIGSSIPLISRQNSGLLFSSSLSLFTHSRTNLKISQNLYTKYSTCKYYFASDIFGNKSTVQRFKYDASVMRNLYPDLSIPIGFFHPIGEKYEMSMGLYNNDQSVILVEETLQKDILTHSSIVHEFAHALIHHRGENYKDRTEAHLNRDKHIR